MSLELKINEAYAESEKILAEYRIYGEGVALDGLYLALCGESERKRVIAVDERVVQVVVLIGELDGRLVENDAFLNAVALCKGACRNIADYYLERHYR